MNESGSERNMGRDCECNAASKEKAHKAITLLWINVFAPLIRWGPEALRQQLAVRNS